MKTFRFQKNFGVDGLTGWLKTKSEFRALIMTTLYGKYPDGNHRKNINSDYMDFKIQQNLQQRNIYGGLIEYPIIWQKELQGSWEETGISREVPEVKLPLDDFQFQL